MPSFQVNDPVITVWGIGKVQSFRASDSIYIVLLDNWKLAQGQSPTLYLGADSMHAVPVPVIDVEQIEVVVEPVTDSNTQTSSNTEAAAAQTDTVSVAVTHNGVFNVGTSVDTVWGSGKVQSFRESDGIYIVLLDHWKLAQGQSPTLYLGHDSMHVSKHVSIFTTGDAVDTVWGVGEVQLFRPSDGIYIVLLDNWKLAQGQSPTLFIGADSMKRIQPPVGVVPEKKKTGKKSSCVVS